MNIPQHVAIIMDGNGRWARQKALARIGGHEEGVKRVEDIITAAPKYGVKYLTLYAFSKENWQRPKHEVDFLMRLLSDYLDKKRADLKKNNIKFQAIGRIGDLPEEIQKKIAINVEESKSHTGLVVTFAFSYSSRIEIIDACQEIAREVAAGKLKLDAITEDTISNHLYTAGLPDPDLLIRTSGEMRISNFLLWQISYSELYFTEKMWPEFTPGEFEKAIQEYQKRERRFGRCETVVPKH